MKIRSAAAMSLVLAAFAVGAAGCGDDDDGGGGDTTNPPGATAGTETGGGAETTAGGSDEAKSTFAATCGGCHTLKAAGTSGTVGPNLDEMKPDSARVLAAIEKGGTGSGSMPANLLEGEEAQAVADYVAENAGG